MRVGRKVGDTEEPASEEERIERSKGLVFEDAVPVSVADARLRYVEPDTLPLDRV